MCSRRAGSIRQDEKRKVAIHRRKCRIPALDFARAAILVISALTAPQTGTEIDVMTRCCWGTCGWMRQLRILDAVRRISNANLVLYAMTVASPRLPESKFYRVFKIFRILDMVSFRRSYVVMILKWSAKSRTSGNPLNLECVRNRLLHAFSCLEIPSSPW